MIRMPHAASDTTYFYPQLPESGLNAINQGGKPE